MKLGEVTDPDEMTALIEEQSELQEKIDAADAWDLDRTVEDRDGRAALPVGRQRGAASLGRRESAAWRCAACCCRKPDMLLLDEPTNHLDAESVAWLQRFLAEYPSTVVMVTHDRYFLDNVTGWILELDRGRGIPYEGNYSAYLEKKQKRLAQEAKQEAARQRTIERELEWVRQGARGRQAKAKAAPDRVRGPAGRKPGQGAGLRPDPDPAAAAAGQRGDQCRSRAQGLRQLPPDRRHVVQPAARRHRRRDRAERRRQVDPCFKMITGVEQPDFGTITLGETVVLGFVDQSRESLDEQEDGVGGDRPGRGRDRPRQQAQDAEPRLCRRVQLQGRRPAEEGRPAPPAANATGCISPRC